MIIKSNLELLDKNDDGEGLQGRSGRGRPGPDQGLTNWTATATGSLDKAELDAYVK